MTAVAPARPDRPGLAAWLGRAFGRDAEPVAPADADTTGLKNLLLLVQLRWIAVGGQIVTMGVVHEALGITLPYTAMLSVLAALVGLNLVSLAWARTRTTIAIPALFGSLIFDVAALTTQLYLTGGATNPFIFLYVLQVTLGAVLLDARSLWAMVASTALCFAGLTLAYRPLQLGTAFDESLFGLHIAGMLICFLLDAALLAVFITRINRNLRQRDSHLANLRQQAAEEDHIVRMGLLASGAAHELGTPLATLSVILGDWRRMPILTADPELSQEIDAMQAEVRRCKTIVTGILLSAGEARGESAAVTTLHAFLDDLVEGWRAARSSPNLTYDNRIRDDLPIVYDSALKQVICTVLDNAIEASPRWVGLEAAREGGMLVLAVTDTGPGFAPDMLQQIGKPYRSSKGKPGGGLGLFLVVNVVRKLGGRVTALNRLGGGAVVTLAFPLTALAIDTQRMSHER